jgi:hypothetical protein
VNRRNVSHAACFKFGHLQIHIRPSQNCITHNLASNNLLFGQEKSQNTTCAEFKMFTSWLGIVIKCWYVQKRPCTFRRKGVGIVVGKDDGEFKHHRILLRLRFKFHVVFIQFQIGVETALVCVNPSTTATVLNQQILQRKTFSKPCPLENRKRLLY